MGSCKMADELQEWMRKSTLKMESVPKGRKSRKSTKKMSEFRNLLSQSGSTSKITKSEKSRKSIKALNDYRKFLSLPEESPVIDEPVENEPKPAVSDLKLNDFKEILVGYRTSDVKQELKDVWQKQKGSDTMMIDLTFINRKIKKFWELARKAFHNSAYPFFYFLVGLSELHGLTLRACMGLLPYFVRRPKKLKPKRVYKITKPEEKVKKARKSYVRKNSETTF